MALRVALVVVALMAASGAARSVPQGPPLPLTSSGWVEASTSADGSETVVSLDVSTPGAAADGLVDLAFRLQHAAALHVEFAGSSLVFAIATRSSALPAAYPPNCSRADAGSRTPQVARGASWTVPAPPAARSGATANPPVPRTAPTGTSRVVPGREAVGAVHLASGENERST